MLSPMLEQTRGFRRHLPVAWIRSAAPLVRLEAEFVDGGRGCVLLVLGGNSLSLVPVELLLIRRGLTLPRLGNRRDELCVAAGFEDALGRRPCSSSSQCRRGRRT